MTVFSDGWWVDELTNVWRWLVHHCFRPEMIQWQNLKSGPGMTHGLCCRDDSWNQSSRGLPLDSNSAVESGRRLQWFFLRPDQGNLSSVPLKSWRFQNKTETSELEIPTNDRSVGSKVCLGYHIPEEVRWRGEGAPVFLASSWGWGQPFQGPSWSPCLSSLLDRLTQSSPGCHALLVGMTDAWWLMVISSWFRSHAWQSDW